MGPGTDVIIILSATESKYQCIPILLIKIIINETILPWKEILEPRLNTPH